MQRIPCVPTLQMRSFLPFGKGDCMGLGEGWGIGVKRGKENIWYLQSVRHAQQARSTKIQESYEDKHTESKKLPLELPLLSQFSVSSSLFSCSHYWHEAFV